MFFTQTKTYCVIGMLALATACSTAPANRIKTEESNPEWQARKLDKVLVLEVYDRTYRISAESVFAAELKEQGINAMTSYEAFPDLQQMGEASQVKQKLDQLDVDAVLTIATLESRQQYDREDWWATYGLLQILGADSERAGGWADVQDASDYYSQGELELDVSLFDAKSLQPIWNATTDSYMFNQGDSGEVTQLADFMVAELAARGIFE